MTTRTKLPDTVTRRGRKQAGQVWPIEHPDSHAKVADALLDQLRVRFEHIDASTLRSMLERLTHNEAQASADRAVNALQALKAGEVECVVDIARAIGAN